MVQTKDNEYQGHLKVIIRHVKRSNFKLKVLSKDLYSKYNIVINILTDIDESIIGFTKRLDK
jgi:hypothetical protein